MDTSTRVRAALAGSFAIVTALHGGAVQAGPFLVRNQHPLVALFGLPAPLPARLPAPGSNRVSALVNWTSFEQTDATGEREYTLDGEVFELRFVFNRGLDERFALQGEAAYRSLDGGSLDGFIDDWHEAFSMPEGSRNKLPQDQLLVEYRTGDQTPLRVDQDTSGMADLPFALGYQLQATDRFAVSAWLSLKAPTGNAHDLTGSGALDASLSLAGSLRPAERWEVFGQANAAWLGQGEVLPELQKDWAWSALAGVTWQAWRGFELTAQFEANSAVFDSGLADLDGDAVVLTVGGSYLASRGWRFDVGVVEDIEADASPDVTFNFAVRRDFGGVAR